MSAWLHIERHIESAGFNRHHLQTLRNFIDAIDPPLELPRIFQNLLHILRAVSDLTRYYDRFDYEISVHEWLAITDEILRSAELQNVIAATNKRGAKPLSGGYGTNPAYIAVWTCQENIASHTYYLHIMAHCLIGSSILRTRMHKHRVGASAQEHNKFDDYRSRICRALLTVRNLTDTDKIDLTDKLPSLLVAPDTLLEIFTTHNQEDRYTQLLPLFRYVLELKHPPHRQEHDDRSVNEEAAPPPHPRNTLPAKKHAIAISSDPDREAFSIDILQLPSVDHDRAKQSEDVGCAPDETRSSVEIASEKQDKEESRKPKTAFQKVVRVKRLKNLLAMCNQRLTSRWDALSKFEVAALDSAIQDLIKKGEKSRFYQVGMDIDELAALICVLFWFGQRIENFKNIKLYNDYPDERKAAGFVNIAEGNCYWWVKPALPKRRKLPDARQQANAFRVDSNFPVWTNLGVEDIIRNYVTTIHRGKSLRLFFKGNQYYREALSGFLAKVNAAFGARLTENRISDYLYDMVSHMKGADLTTSMFLFGRKHFLGHNPSFYTCLSIESLQVTYHKVCRKVWDDLDNGPPPPDGQTPLCPIEPSTTCRPTHVGSPFRPTIDSVKSLVENLKSSLINSHNHHDKIDRLIRLHNNMTRYTAFMTAFCTGFRAIRDPFLSSAVIYWESGFAVLSDKDNEDQYNSRLIWLPPVCLEQLRLFRNHQRAVLIRFNALISPDFFSGLDSPRREAPENYLFLARPKKNSPDIEVIPFSPNSNHIVASCDYFLPFNASRHFLRSNLMEANCPIDVVNSFLGHFERGEEPNGRYSCLAPNIYRNILQEKLLPILKECEWKAIPGLGATL